jgi:hypothetical protein
LKLTFAEPAVYWMVWQGRVGMVPDRARLDRFLRGCGWLLLLLLCAGHTADAEQSDDDSCN